MLLLLPAGVSVTGEPKGLLSTAHWSVPVGGAAEPELLVTVAMKVTDWPVFEGFKEDETVVEVAAAVTVKDPVLSLLVEWTASAG